MPQLYEEGKRRRKDVLEEGVDYDADPAVILEKRQEAEAQDRAMTAIGFAFAELGIGPEHFAKAEPDEPVEEEVDPFDELLGSFPKVFNF